MAIKVGGTTVIDDTRQLTNIASVDAATVTALSTAGAGLPSQTGNGGNVLTTNGTSASWTAPSGGAYEVVSNTTHSNVGSVQFSFTQDKMHIFEITDLFGSVNNYIQLQYRDSSNNAQTVRWGVWDREWQSSTINRDSNTTTSPRLNYVTLDSPGGRTAQIVLKIYQTSGKATTLTGTGTIPLNNDPHFFEVVHGQQNATTISNILIFPNTGTLSYRLRILREV